MKNAQVIPFLVQLPPKDLFFSIELAPKMEGLAHLTVLPLQ
jgi:hypothetical protein